MMERELLHNKYTFIQKPFSPLFQPLVIMSDDGREVFYIKQLWVLFKTIANIYCLEKDRNLVLKIQSAMMSSTHILIDKLGNKLALVSAKYLSLGDTQWTVLNNKGDVVMNAYQVQKFNRNSFNLNVGKSKIGSFHRAGDNWIVNLTGDHQMIVDRRIALGLAFILLSQGYS